MSSPYFMTSVINCLFNIGLFFKTVKQRLQLGHTSNNAVIQSSQGHMGVFNMREIKCLCDAEIL